MHLEGKVCVITGAARGIGYEIAKVFAENGALMALVDLSFDDDFNFPYGEFRQYEADISDHDKVKELIKAITVDFKRIDCLINNAGITKDSLIMRMKEKDFDSVIAVNLKGVFNMCKHAMRPLTKSDDPSIINISSVVGLMGNPGQCNYSASKAGVIGLTRSLAKEMAGKNVRVNAVAPGYIKTPMTDKLSQNQQEAISQTIPLKRLGNPDDVANVCLFLASTAAGYVTGQVLAVDGGMTMY
ncbi:MAG: 3-oxoacyl-[acyl-carrier-protein] reductase [Candidatus Muiribacterium halophilum]|uniref:3-oxoacyl-[acyl-carrier-protein] reductase n=1 Tax=Muiribacterium halophilum TaxID=2053465 RepID=A0A2N5ZGQ2_MUIH1|nr:MAG: 3-oxoacyl-[acyl-carrier-protein] reductase [Candidatus Muirbacterium halophilum]